jgi:malate dehydrogenase (oxaloacetate-decarboxylating)
MANPTPEIMPDKAKNAGARIVGTGRSDFPNQINNVLVFPGIFRGALDANATEITENMKLAAAKALAEHIKENELSEENIIPSALDKSIAFEVAKAVKIQAELDGIVRN